jgi:hypothetical protein
MDFTVNDVHVAACVRIVLLELVLQKLQVEDNRVDRIFNLVSDSTR